jgi:hypothetical protein
MDHHPNISQIWRIILKPSRIFSYFFHGSPSFPGLHPLRNLDVLQIHAALKHQIIPKGLLASAAGENLVSNGFNDLICKGKYGKNINQNTLTLTSGNVVQMFPSIRDTKTSSRTCTEVSSSLVRTLGTAVHLPFVGFALISRQM